MKKLLILLPIVFLTISCSSTKVENDEKTKQTIISESDSSVRIIDRNSNNLVVNSTPQNADIYLLENGTYVKIGRTPLLIYAKQNYYDYYYLKKNGYHQIKIEKDGYISKEITVKRENCVDVNKDSFHMAELIIPTGNRILPNGEIIITLEPTEETKVKLAEEEAERLRIEQRNKQWIEEVVRGRDVVSFDFRKLANPYSFDKNVVYLCSEDIWVYQWLSDGFVGSTIHESGSIYYTDNIKFICKLENKSNVSNRIKNVYMEYKGTETYLNGLGTQVVLPIFEILLFTYYK